MTEELCSADAHLTTCDARLTAVTEEGVVLDRTVCYARGGGQPGDTGTLRWDGGEATVTDTVKSRESGDVVHVVEGATPAVGTPVTVEIDWARRYTHMRTHTALHALSGIVFFGHGVKVTGGNMESGGLARMDFELDEIFSAVPEWMPMSSPKNR
jgi:misacylated tRNA(Ala) deacylase